VLSWLPDILENNRWQMSPGERAAISGILADLAPEIAIEIGTGDGGSLRVIAAHARHVHAFDIVPPAADLTALPNVTFHTGDSHELLPRVLGQLAEQNVNVDFVLVDGDHSPAGVRRDVEDLLSSPAISRSLIFLHDTANSDVRVGLDAIKFAQWPKLTWVDLDWVPGFVFREGPSQGEAWAGLGIMITDAENGPAAGPAEVAGYAYPVTAPCAARPMDNRQVESEPQQVETLRRRVEDLERLRDELVSSVSWRVTRPLRVLKGSWRK
jgi:hypothetical protein